MLVESELCIFLAKKAVELATSSAVAAAATADEVASSTAFLGDRFSADSSLFNIASSLIPLTKLIDLTVHHPDVNRSHRKWPGGSGVLQYSLKSTLHICGISELMALGRSA